MSISSSGTQLLGATKNLLLKWEQTQSSWRDPRSQAFEDDLLQFIEPHVRVSMAAMTKMGELLSRIRQECQ